jgi:hypothetical protein
MSIVDKVLEFIINELNIEITEKNKELIIRDVSRIDKKTPLTTDEYLYEIARIKNNINQQLLNDMVYIPYLLTNTSINICKKIKDTVNKLKIFHSPDNRGDKKHVKKLKNEGTLNKNLNNKIEESLKNIYNDISKKI